MRQRKGRFSVASFATVVLAALEASLEVEISFQYREGFFVQQRAERFIHERIFFSTGVLDRAVRVHAQEAQRPAAEWTEVSDLHQITPGVGNHPGVPPLLFDDQGQEVLVVSPHCGRGKLEGWVAVDDRRVDDERCPIQDAQLQDRSCPMNILRR